MPFPGKGQSGVKNSNCRIILGPRLMVRAAANTTFCPFPVRPEDFTAGTDT